MLSFSERPTDCVVGLDCVCKDVCAVGECVESVDGKAAVKLITDLFGGDESVFGGYAVELFVFNNLEKFFLEFNGELAITIIEKLVSVFVPIALLEEYGVGAVVIVHITVLLEISSAFAAVEGDNAVRLGVVGDISGNGCFLLHLVFEGSFKIKNKMGNGFEFIGRIGKGKTEILRFGEFAVFPETVFIIVINLDILSLNPISHVVGGEGGNILVENVVVDYISVENVKAVAESLVLVVNGRNIGIFARINL